MIRPTVTVPREVQLAATNTMLAFLAQVAGEPTTAGWDGERYVFDKPVDPYWLDEARRVAYDEHGIPWADA